MIHKIRTNNIGRSLLAILMVIILVLGGSVLGKFGSLKVHAASAGSNGYYGSVSNLSFEMTDIRGWGTKGFKGSSGKTTVIIFDMIGSYSNSTLQQFARIAQYLDTETLDILAIDT